MLNEKTKWLIVSHCCLHTSKEELVLKRADAVAIGELFGVSARSIYAVFKEFKEKFQQNETEVDLAPVKVGRVGRKRKELDGLDACITESLVEARGDLTYRELLEIVLAEGYPLSLSTLYERCAQLGLFTVTNHIKPMLNELSKMRRLRFVLRMIDFSDLRSLKFKTC
jgi:hypothetical protein